MRRRSSSTPTDRSATRRTADFNGSDSFTYHAFDGQASSGVVTVTITVNAVNDDPGFQAGSDQEVSSLSTILTGVNVPAWATGIDPGPPDEDAQTVSFQVTTDNDAAFIDLPQVAADGTLTYRPQLTLIQIAVNVTVTAQDSGGAESASQAFTITITPDSRRHSAAVVTQALVPEPGGTR